jgi:hypothetical protein
MRYLMLLLVSSLAVAQGFTGVWIAKGSNRTVTLKIQSSNGQIGGTLEGMGETFTLSGKANGNRAEGTAKNPSGVLAYFKWSIESDVLNLTLANFDSSGKPDPSTAVKIALKRPEGPKAQAAFTVPGFAPPPDDPVLGKWNFKSINLEFQAGKTGYNVTLQIGKQRSKFTAKGIPENLRGTYRLGGRNRVMTAKINTEKDLLVVTLDGKTYTLARVR